MRNYETIYHLLEQLKTLAADEEIFAQSERDRLRSPLIARLVCERFADETPESAAAKIAPILRESYLVQFFDYRGERFFLELPHLRIFAYLCGCFGRFAPNESLADFAVAMATLARDHIAYSEPKIGQIISDLARQ